MTLEVAPPTTDRRDALVGRLFQSAIETAEILSIAVGDRLGLYAALKGDDALTAGELTTRLRIDERLTREWLEQQAVAGFLEVDDPAAAADQRRYHLPAEFREIFLDPDSPIHLTPFAALLGLLASHVPDVAEAFRSSNGVTYDRFGPEARRVQERVNRPLYTTMLPHVWLPELPDLHARLVSDPPARVADIGCGAGWASISIARAYPRVIVDGFDTDALSIEMARANASAAGVADRVHFHVQDAADPTLSGTYDVVAAFVMLHDVARPVETLQSMRRLAAPDATILVMDMKVADEFSAPGAPADRFAYCFSLLFCLPISQAESPTAATGTVMRRSTFEHYAQTAGYQKVDILPLNHDFFQFYRLTP